MRVSLVDCSGEHMPALHAFFARVYHPDHVLLVREDFFRWQFQGPVPRGGDPLNLALATIDGEIAACLGYIPVGCSVAGRAIRAAWLVNWIVDPKHRQVGLGPLLVRELTDRFDALLNIGPNATARALLKAMAWSDVGPLKRFVRVLDVEQAGMLTEAGRLEWPHGAPGVPQLVTAPTVSRVYRFADDVTQLWARQLSGRATGVRRTSEYLNWRYADHPVFEYRLFEARLWGGLAGIAVYRVEPVRGLPVRVGRIVELLSDEGYEDALLHAMVEDARSRGVALLDFFCSSGRLSASMSRSGFVAGEHGPATEIPLLFQPVDRRRREIHLMAYLREGGTAADVDDWYVTKGDGDQDRPN